MVVISKVVWLQVFIMKGFNVILEENFLCVLCLCVFSVDFEHMKWLCTP